MQQPHSSPQFQFKIHKQQFQTGPSLFPFNFQRQSNNNIKATSKWHEDGVKIQGNSNGSSNGTKQSQITQRSSRNQQLSASPSSALTNAFQPCQPCPIDLVATRWRHIERKGGGTDQSRPRCCLVRIFWDFGRNFVPNPNIKMLI
ncbi:hypothetical protein H5410_059852 [Solanum commersonii]|uniref:Uncharacterized protein n=1 Tax=Solanum commersonii TaxID=4109 RepID=A0A9J5W4Q9_SOLCO|nr:hypothetical protein H5410_059852 [Solanum commersonii]